MQQHKICLYLQTALHVSGGISTPSSGAHITVSTVTVSIMPDTLDTVIRAPDDGWRYHLKHVEQFTYINKLYIAASLPRLSPPCHGGGGLRTSMT